MYKVLISIIAAAALLAACGDDSDPTEDALTAVCDAEAGVVEDLAALGTVDPGETTGDEFRGMVESLQSSVDDLRAARADFIEQDVDNVTSAFDSLKSELSELSDIPLAELEDASSAAIGAAVEEFQTAYAEAYANSSCTSDGSE